MCILILDPSYLIMILGMLNYLIMLKPLRLDALNFMFIISYKIIILGRYWIDIIHIMDPR